jgi:flagellar hook-associated protein 2
MVTGVVSGAIDVSSIVSQLMQVERLPLTRLEQRETEIQSRLSAFGRVQSSLSTLETALATLAKPAGFAATKASVSGSGVEAVTSGTPAEGRYAIAVTQLARAQSMASARVATATTDIGTGTVTIKSGDGSTVLGTFDVGDSGAGTLTELRNEINAAGIGVRASLVNDAGEVRLVLNAKETGSASAFTLETSAGLAALAFSTQQGAQDAQFKVNGLALTASSNTIDDAIEGVTLTLTSAPPAGAAPGTTVDGEVIVGIDTTPTIEAANAFVKAYNDIEKLIGDLTRYDPNTRTAAILNGESVLRTMQAQLRAGVRAAVSGTAGDYARLSEVGITVQTDGSLKLDASKFEDLVAADPAKVGRLFSASSATEGEQGLAVRLRAMVKALTQPDGTLDARQDGLRASIKTLDAQQERMEARLTLIEQRLTRQYSALDALLAVNSSRSTALANALAGLPNAA